jgi:hypothetical protein
MSTTINKFFIIQSLMLLGFLGSFTLIASIPTCSPTQLDSQHRVEMLTRCSS